MEQNGRIMKDGMIEIGNIGNIVELGVVNGNSATVVVDLLKYHFRVLIK